MGRDLKGRDLEGYNWDVVLIQRNKLWKEKYLGILTEATQASFTNRILEIEEQYFLLTNVLG